MQKERERIAAVAAALFGLVLAALFAAAMVDGQRRYAETPFRAVLGDQRYEELMAGRGGFPHYLGASLEAPDFTLPTRDGESFTLSSRRGRVVVLNFWNSTCRPCVEEMPTLEDLALLVEDFGDVDVVTVSTDPDWETVAPIVPAESRLVQLIDPDRTVVADLFGTHLYPETWIIDRDGLVRFRYDGGFDWSSPVVIDVIDAYR